MKAIYNKNFVFLHKKRAFFALLVALFCMCLFCLCGCQKQIDYFDYVSELRCNLLTAETDGFSLRIYAVEKEYPYAMDGVKRDVSTRAEFRLIAPSGNETYLLAFGYNGETQSGEMSYDNVKAEYYYSCSLDISATTELSCSISNGKEEICLVAKTVKTAETITPQNALQRVVEYDGETFSARTDKYGFAGEICIRLIYEESPYYYVGVVDRNGKQFAYLLNAESGKILAKRQA